MLQNFREHMQGIIAWTIVGIICFTFALWGIQSYLHGKSDTDVIAKVNGTEITQAQIRAAYERFRRKETMTSGTAFTPDQNAQQQIKKNIFQQIVKNKLLSHETKKMGLYASGDQITAMVTAMPVFQVKGVFSIERFQQILQGMMYTEKELFTELGNDIISTQLTSGIAATDFVLPNEIDAAIKLAKQKRDFGYFYIAPKLSAKNAFTAQQMQDYYAKHKDAFITPEKIAVSYVLLSASDLQNKIVANAQDLLKFYQEHAGAYKNKKFAVVKNQVHKDFLRQKAMELLSEKNDKLADLTYTNSDSLQPAANELGLKIQNTELFTQAGGKAGITKNPKFIKAAFSDTVLKQGYNSNPIELGEGTIVVLRIKQHIPSSFLPLNLVQNQVKAMLTREVEQQQAERLAAKVLQDLQNKKSPQVIAKEYHLPWQVVAKASRDDRKVNAKILTAAFDLPMPQKGSVSATSVALAGVGSAVVELFNVYPGDVKQVNAFERKKIADELQRNLGAYTYDLWMGGLHKNAKIEMLHPIGETE